jgi:signal transduction histidine kinase
LYIQAKLNAIPGPTGAPESFFLILRDITEEKKEHLLKQSFLSLISHKLRSPLTTICGYLSLISEGEKNLPPELRDYFRRIDRRSRELNSLVEKLLAYTDIINEGMSADEKTSNVNEALRRSASDVAQRYIEKKVHIENSLPSELPDLAISQGSLTMVFSNLLDNAVKFNDKEEVIVEIRGTIGDEEVEFSVSDNGRGIPDQDVERIFKPFYQVERSMTGNIEGVGLGLPLVKHLLETHGGKMRVESTPGKGSTFTFNLPRCSFTGRENQ